VLELSQIEADWSTVPQSRAIQAAENKKGPGFSGRRAADINTRARN
jgi:hypothetical protein